MGPQRGGDGVRGTWVREGGKNAGGLLVAMALVVTIIHPLWGEGTQRQGHPPVDRPGEAGGSSAQPLGPGGGDVIAKRNRVMKSNGYNVEDIKDKQKAGKIEDIEVNALNIALNAGQIPSLFPQGSLGGKTRAKPEIWQNWQDFVARARELEVQAEALEKLAEAGNKGGVASQLPKIEAACQACHDRFRTPE